MTRISIDNVFTYHAPGPIEIAKYGELREKAKELAHLIFDTCPPSEDRAIALRKLRECIMTANASIAIAGSAKKA